MFRAGFPTEVGGNPMGINFCTCLIRAILILADEPFPATLSLRGEGFLPTRFIVYMGLPRALDRRPDAI